MPLKLVQINFSQNVGSTGRIAEQIGELAMTKGWESFIVSGRQHSDSKSHSIRINNRFDILWHVFLTHFADMDGRCSYLATKKLVKKLKEIKPDIVHLHVVHESYINYPILFQYLKDTDMPVVWTFHDCWSLTGHCAHFDYIGCEKWKTLCQNCGANKNYRKLEFFIQSTYNHKLKMQYFSSIDKLTIVPVSDWLEGRVRQSFLKNKNICTIKNGIDLKVFSPTSSNIRERLGIGNKFFVLGCAGTWSKMKGYDEFVELAHIHPEWYFVLVGLPVSMHALLPENIHGVSFTNGHKELAEYYSAADVFVNPTYNEALGLTNVESLACGTPVVTYKTGGSPETIDDTCGISVPRGDKRSLENAIVEIQKNGKLYYTQACRNRAEMHFDKNQKYQDYIDLYNRLLTKI